MKRPAVKRELDEVLALYKLEPSLKDIYVEGVNDARILRWFLSKNGQHDITVYDIQLVDIPKNLFEGAGLNPDCTRNHVILLSEKLSHGLAGGRRGIRCIADVDFDRHLGACRKNDVLQYTDYTCMEMYLFNEKTLERFVNFVLGDFPESVPALVKNLKHVLERLFLLRLANQKLEWSMTWVDIKDYTSYAKGKIGFDERRYVNSYLMRNGRSKAQKAFQKTIEELAAQLDSDSRHNIRGHDFTYLLFLSSRRHLGRRFVAKNWETFETLFCGFVEFDEIAREPLFVALGKL